MSPDALRNSLRSNPEPITVRSLFRSWILLALVLLVPILPFLAFGKTLERQIESYLEHLPPAPITAAVVVILLASDILLPIPSSLVSTAAGWQLGWLLGAAASWSGMSLGAAFGFALARRWGRPLALWFSREDDLQQMSQLSQRYGPTTLVLTRAVPVLAEACVLLMGMHGLSWRRFLPPVLLSNVGVALAYSTFGGIAGKNHWLPLALGVSVALPLLLTTLVRATMIRWRQS